MSDYQKIYETEATNTGGRDGFSYLEDGSYEVKITTPKEMGGSGAGQNPEQLFALGYSACFHGALEIIKGKHKVREDSQVTNIVRLYKKPDAADFQLAVEITVAIRDLDTLEVQKLADEAHKVCPYSKAVSDSIEVTVRAVNYDASKEK
ncbi:organic hydroperoxide resistance protein [Aerococcus urinaeequi]|uniref:Organic hydroperoxide resistance protein n=1 Tax=Aerococcus urinaeequi TaxID=51665 RepID=A0AAF0BIX6_9LACT|nr:organic hydroperoxide resistance protein [Aerococcus urinaeequi]QGS37225.1 Ohr family peroxiredoxin [Aerococcus viridans]WCG37035.1 organic hydroperoxide resistance protein [Aerococcus urinaeequi]